MSFSLGLDFSNLQYNPLSVPPDAPGGVIKAFPFLENVPELKDFWKRNSDKYRDFALRYMLLLYSKETPLLGMYPSLEARKEKAYAVIQEFMGYELRKALKDAVMELTDWEFSDLVVGYIRYLNDRDWQMVITLEQLLDQYHKKVFSTISMEDEKDEVAVLERKDKIMQAIDKYTNMLDGYYARMSVGDKSLAANIRKAITGMITPEYVADLLENSDDV